LSCREQEYENSIVEDFRWLLQEDMDLGTCAWDGIIRRASDYFGRLEQIAKYLIQEGHAYVDDLTPGSANWPTFLCCWI
jgi:glutaminyl-tRNA synthetase